MSDSNDDLSHKVAANLALHALADGDVQGQFLASDPMLLLQLAITDNELAAFIDGNADPHLRERVLHHLASNEELRQVWLNCLLP